MKTTQQAEHLGRETAKRLGVEPEEIIFPCRYMGFCNIKYPLSSLDYRSKTVADAYAALGRSVLACREACDYDAALTRAREEMRERCAKAAKSDIDRADYSEDEPTVQAYMKGWNGACKHIAAAIRSLPTEQETDRE